MKDATPRRFTLARPWMIAIGLMQLVGVALWAARGEVMLVTLRLSSEVQGSLLIDAGAIIDSAAGPVLQNDGIMYTPQDSKISGLGAFFLFPDYCGRLSLHQHVATGWMVLTAFAWIMGAFSLLPRESPSARPI